MKARKFVLIYFKTVKATQSTQGKKNYRAKKSQHAAKENEFTPEQRKTRPQKKKKKKNWQIHWEPVMRVILKQFLCELWQFVI